MIIIIIIIVHLFTVGKKNDSHNLENKMPLQPDVTYLYPLKTSKILQVF